ncbi:xaa-pro aminopeptidase [hydrocarbon metagenome]|uniref:Xaa-pro aminopeptidase n=1 Tax=hydrocarbon metagenome TaxID=938273 RepID=A0A0W8E4T7_9ZZZZ
MTPKDELQRRIKGLQDKMNASACEAVLIVQNVDLYYFSGTMQNARLYIPATGEPVLFCRKSISRATHECPWNIVSINNYRYIPDKLNDLGRQLPGRLGLEYDVLTVADYLSVKRVFPNAELLDASNWIADLRATKSPFEIGIIKKAGRSMADAFAYVPDLIKQGRSELAVAAGVERVLRDQGHQGYVRMRGFNQEFFYGHFLSGPNGCIAGFNDGVTAGMGMGAFFPQGPGERIIQIDEPVFLDYVGVFDGYNIDQTRLYVVGVLPDKLKDAFQVALEIQETLINQVKPGAIASDLYDLAIGIADRAGLSQNFMGYGSERVKFVGHGVGLELDERPVIAKGFNVELEAGMVIALEPKFVIPGMGIAGIENTWLVTRSGVEKITILPDDLVVIPH